MYINIIWIYLYMVVFVFNIHTYVEICVCFTYPISTLLTGGVLRDLQESAHVVPVRCYATCISCSTNSKAASIDFVTKRSHYDNIIYTSFHSKNKHTSCHYHFAIVYTIVCPIISSCLGAKTPITALLEVFQVRNCLMAWRRFIQWMRRSWAVHTALPWRWAWDVPDVDGWMV